MANQPAEAGRQFKDYYDILRLLPDADGAGLDQAYWRLARPYNAAMSSDRSAKEKLDDLNEAYSVLGSSARRKEYDKLRDAVLGEGALPPSLKPEPEPEPQPEVGAKQRPSRQRLNLWKLSVLPWRWGLKALATVLLVRKLFRLPSRPTLTLQRPTIRAPSLPERRPARPGIDPDTLRQSTKAMLGRWRESTEGLLIPQSAAPTPHQEPSPSNQDGEHGSSA